MSALLLPAEGQLLNVWAEIHPRVTRVVLDGPVCAFTAPHLEAELWRIVACDRDQIEIDARNATVFTSDGVDVLQRLRDGLSDRGGRVWISSLSRITQRVLEICEASDLCVGVEAAGRSGNGSSEPDRPVGSTTTDAHPRG